MKYKIYIFTLLLYALKFERLILTAGLLFFPQFTYILSDIFIGFTFATFLKLFHRHDFCIVHYIYKYRILKPSNLDKTFLQLTCPDWGEVRGPGTTPPHPTTPHTTSMLVLLATVVQFEV